uniref:Protein-serine/threonine kinase n=1 Tax=Noctiluca scintillans TaxID=2966 RepID=A0A7S1AJX3_NOCSC|mmetsp:Transcript_49402/g.131091  ORF Transcript_49402/g.131091 Transcript_49402/m.131091 type:complete len:386 (+) Transcript_49402:95-1252(+)
MRLARCGQAISRRLTRALHGGKELSESRLRQFLRAEVTHFASFRTGNLTLSFLLKETCTPHEAAHCVHHQLSERFARRIVQIEDLEGWENDPDLRQVHERYFESFQEMRMAEVGEDLGEFTKMVRRLKERQKPVLQELGKACHRMRQQGGKYDQAFWNTWLEIFLRSRISTEMLTSQYIAVVNQTAKGSTEVTGIVDPLCDPAMICEGAVAAARLLCQNNMGILPNVEVESRSKVSLSFSYIPIYLYYIILEVLKNSCAATAKRRMSSLTPCDGEPIHVVVCADDVRVAVRVRDLAGGIPYEVGDRVWDFLYSGSQDVKADAYAGSTPLQGFGIGLPLARLYAKYLGGSLSLISLPGYGVDTFLSLPRIESCRGVLKRDETRDFR